MDHPHWILSQFSEVQVSPSADALSRSAGEFTRTQDLGDFLQFKYEKVRAQCGWTDPHWGLSRFYQKFCFRPSAGGSPALRLSADALRVKANFEG